MKKLLFYLLLGSLILTISCSENSPFLPGDEFAQHESTLKSYKPMAKLVGYTEETLWVDMNTGAPYSIGTITFEGLGTFGLVYQILDMSQKENSNAMFLTETFYVFEEYGWDLNDLDIEAILAMDVLLKGTNSGVSPNGKKFITNGSVSEASGEFEGWTGRNVHVQGDIAGPASFTSKLQVN